jgi:hypothetical protein
VEYNNDSDAKCMSCSVEFDVSFMEEHFGKSFLWGGKYQQKVKDKLFADEQSKIPSTMTCFEEYKKIENIRKEIRVLLNQVDAKETQIRNIRGAIENYKNGTTATMIPYRPADQKQPVEEEEPEEKVLFKCNNCPGFVSSDYKCLVCSSNYCRKCRVEKKPLKDAEGKDIVHECKQEDIDTLKFLKETSKPCPGCKVFIHKIEGCYQMFCTNCNTFFEWGNLKIIKDLRMVHNPHATEYLRRLRGSDPTANANNRQFNCENITFNSMLLYLPRETYRSLERSIDKFPSMTGKARLLNQHRDILRRSMTDQNYRSSLVRYRMSYIQKEISIDTYKTNIFALKKRHSYFSDLIRVFDLCNEVCCQRSLGILFNENNINSYKTYDELIKLDFKRYTDEIVGIFSETQKVVSDINKMYKYSTNNYRL